LAEATVTYSTEDTVIIVNGGVRTAETAQDALEAGADLVTLGRSALANPDWPRCVKSGRELADFDRTTLLKPEASISEDELSIGASPTDHST
jgi:2,4-dienoyl-CoA reductase-like NADH-dependent reductase (Old Yellow Enzyme family)